MVFIQTGVFPSKLKEAMVIPVFKNKGSPLNPENYRPISLLSNIDKVYQKLMQKRLNNFLDNLLENPKTVKLKLYFS